MRLTAIVRSQIVGSPPTSGSCAATPAFDDHHVEPAERLDGAGDRRLDLLALGDVALEATGASPHSAPTSLELLGLEPEPAPPGRRAA